MTDERITALEATVERFRQALNDTTTALWQEREACAKTAESMGSGEIAQAIRSRG